MNNINEPNPFEIYPFNDGLPSPAESIIASLVDSIPAILARHLPAQKAVRIIDRGEWGRRIFDVTLDSGERVLVKFHVHEDWFYSRYKTRAVYNLLHQCALSATELVAADDTRTLAPFAFVIEKKGRGVRLDRLLKNTPQEERGAIYRAVGWYYRRMHEILGPRPGYWVEDPAQPFDIHPNEFYLQNDIGGTDGSGYKVVKMGYITRPTLERVIETWRSHMDELKNHPPALVHGTAAPWTIFLEKHTTTGEYQVSRIGADDMAWWDPAFDLTMLRWPPLSDIRSEDWQALAEAYGPLPGERRFLLYRLMQSLLTACWAYMGPKTLK